MLIAPLGIKDIEYDNVTSKETYIEIGFGEVKIVTASQQTNYLVNTVQVQRKQYVLKYHVTSTIHATMGDTLPIMATEISRNNSN